MGLSGGIRGRIVSLVRGGHVRKHIKNGTMIQAFSWYLPPDGQHWRRLAKLASGFADQGITAAWLPPAYKGQAGQNDVGYGVYDLWDLGEFDQRGSVRTKYGTRREYKRAIESLQDAGIDVLADIVLNHRMGADATEEVTAIPVAADNRLYDMGEPETITAETRFTFPGRAGSLNKFTWDWRCFKGVDRDRATLRGQEADREGVWLFQGKKWDEDVDGENGNYDYLMGADVDVNDPKVYRQLFAWAKWYLRVTGVDGLRLDALKHISRGFYRRFLADLRKECGKELFTVGEYWSGDVNALTAYLGDDPQMSLFDVPLHYRFYNMSVDREHIDFTSLTRDTLTSRDPVHSVTFVDNHDTQPNQALTSTVEPWFKPIAYAFILLRDEGYPCVFFSDLYGLPNDEIPQVPELGLLMEIRRRFAFGEQRDYIDEPDLAGWTRAGDERHRGGGVAVLLSNRGPAEKVMCVGAEHAGERWRAVIGDDNEVTIAEDGTAAFSTHGLMLSVYLPVEAAERLDHIPVVNYQGAAVLDALPDEQNAGLGDVQ